MNRALGSECGSPGHMLNPFFLQSQVFQKQQTNAHMRGNGGWANVVSNFPNNGRTTSRIAAQKICSAVSCLQMFHDSTGCRIQTQILEDIPRFVQFPLTRVLDPPPPALVNSSSFTSGCARISPGERTHTAASIPPTKRTSFRQKSAKVCVQGIPYHTYTNTTVHKPRLLANSSRSAKRPRSSNIKEYHTIVRGRTRRGASGLRQCSQSRVLILEFVTATSYQNSLTPTSTSDQLQRNPPPPPSVRSNEYATAARTNNTTSARW